MRSDKGSRGWKGELKGGFEERSEQRGARREGERGQGETKQRSRELGCKKVERTRRDVRGRWW